MTSDLIQLACVLRALGLTISQISKRLKQTPSEVWKVCKHVKTPRQLRIAAAVEKVRREKFPWRLACKKYGVVYSTLARALKK